MATDEEKLIYYIRIVEELFFLAQKQEFRKMEELLKTMPKDKQQELKKLTLAMIERLDQLESDN